jgi:hypothetical protein
VAAARAASCCLLVLLVAACGSSGHARRDAVNAYLGQVEKAQAALVGAQGQIGLTLQAFSLTKPPANEVPRLTRAQRTAVASLQRLKALKPPPDALQLHGLIVRRIELQVALFDSLIETLRDLPRLAAAGPPLTAAARRLSSDLAAIGGTQVKGGGSKAFLDRYAEAFGRYGDALEPVGEKLASATPESLLRPTISAEHSVIVRSTRLCNRIRSTLQKNDIDGANTSIHELLTLTQRVGGGSVRAAQEAAARAYDAKVSKLDSLAAQINIERSRLVKQVG